MIALASLAAVGCAKSAGTASAGTAAATSPAGASVGQSGAASVVIPKDAQGIQTVTLRARAIPDYLQIPGRVVPDPTQVVHVFAAAGGRLLQMNVRPWDRVEKGQTLASLESSDVSRAV